MFLAGGYKLLERSKEAKREDEEEEEKAPCVSGKLHTERWIGNRRSCSAAAAEFSAQCELAHFFSSF